MVPTVHGNSQVWLLWRKDGAVLLLWGLSRPKGWCLVSGAGDTGEQQARGEAGIEGGARQSKHKPAAQVMKHL